MNILYIDTRNNKEIIVRLDTNGKVYEEKSEAVTLKAQAVLPIIEKLLNATNLKMDNIDEINVERGPGSFTGLRVGVSIANALSLALGRKVNDLPIGETETPKY